MTAQTITGIGPEIASKVGLEPAARVAGAVNGTGFDRRGFNSLALIGVTGAVSGAPSTQAVDFKLQHSDTLGGTYADFVPSIPQPGATGALAQITAVSAVKKRSVDIKTAKAFMRVVGTTAFTGGTAPTLLSSAVVVLGGADVLPIADDA
ncbi:MAG: hypothetical protein Q8K32_31395 [Archangium sp.]|nr:hypothetical protein [Archangium sp.]